MSESDEEAIAIFEEEYTIRDQFKVLKDKIANLREQLNNGRTNTLEVEMRAIEDEEYALTVRLAVFNHRKAAFRRGRSVRE